MGRLSKAKRDIIQKMIREGYTTKEIVSKVGCSASTVARIKKEVNRNDEPKTESTIVFTLLRLLYQMYLGYELNHILNENDLLNYSRNCVIELTENILESDNEFVKKNCV